MERRKEEISANRGRKIQRLVGYDAEQNGLNSLTGVKVGASVVRWHVAG